MLQGDKDKDELPSWPRCNKGLVASKAMFLTQMLEDLMPSGHRSSPSSGSPLSLSLSESLSLSLSLFLSFFLQGIGVARLRTSGHWPAPPPFVLMSGRHWGHNDCCKRRCRLQQTSSSKPPTPYSLSLSLSSSYMPYEKYCQHIILEGKPQKQHYSSQRGQLTPFQPHELLSLFLSRSLASLAKLRV